MQNYVHYQCYLSTDYALSTDLEYEVNINFRLSSLTHSNYSCIFAPITTPKTLQYEMGSCYFNYRAFSYTHYGIMAANWSLLFSIPLPMLQE